MPSAGGKARKPVGLGEGCEEGQTVRGFLGPAGQNGAFPLNGMGGQEEFSITCQNSCIVTESFYLFDKERAWYTVDAQ